MNDKHVHRSASLLEFKWNQTFKEPLPPRGKGLGKQKLNSNETAKTT